MKKVILVLSVIGLMTACSSSTSEDVKTTDSTAVAVDTTNIIVADSITNCRYIMP